MIVVSIAIGGIIFCLVLVLHARRVRSLELNGRVVKVCPACDVPHPYHDLMCPIRAATCLECGGIATHVRGCSRLDEGVAA